MRYTDTSVINEAQKASLKSSPVILNAVKLAEENGVKEIKITSQPAGYANDLFVYVNAGTKTITALFYGNKLMEVS